MSRSTAEFAEAYSKAWADHDPDAIVAMHTEDSVFHQHGLGEPAVGRAAVREAVVAVFAMAPDIAFAFRRRHFAADHYSTEYEVSGTIGDKRASCEGADVFTLRDGLIARKDSYLDTLSFATQVGMT
ncbi:MAG: hypothetical protein NVSMB4_09180 [Acidimicrobiales bacterium]